MSVASTPIQPSRISFGRRLRQARNRLGLSGAQLSSQLGLKRAAVPHYEAGRAFPSVSVLKELTRILGVSVDWLLFDEYEDVGAIQDKDLADYFSKADQLQPQQRALIKLFLGNMLAPQEFDQIKRAPSKRKRAA